MNYIRTCLRCLQKLLTVVVSSFSAFFFSSYSPTPAVEAVDHHLPHQGHIIDLYSLADAGGIHLEEGVVHEEVKSFLLPGSAGVLVPAEAAQQLDAGPVAGGVMSTTRGERRYENNEFWFVCLFFCLLALEVA